MSASVCPRHPGLPADDRCARCGAPFCATCRVDSLASEQSFCSTECRDVETGVGRPAVVDTPELASGVESPIRMGWSLTLRSLPTVAAHLTPIAVALAALLWYGEAKLGDAFDDQSVLPSHLSFAGWTLFGYGAALIAVLQTGEHTGFSPGNAYLWTLRRFIPWAFTWLITGVIVVFGMVLLIIPGLMLGIRLFWADEFALVMQSGPVESIRQSWRLTRGRAWRIFSFQFVLGFAEYVVLIPAFLLGAAIHAAVRESGFGGHAAVEAMVSVVIFLIAFVTYSAAHAPEVIYFYGLRAQAGEGARDATRL